LTQGAREGQETLAETARGVAKQHLQDVVAARAGRVGDSQVPNVSLGDVLKSVNSMPEMVDAITDAADDVWKPIDDASGNQFRDIRAEVRQANTQLYRAVGDEQKKAAQTALDQANGRMNDFLERAKGVVTPQDIQQGIDSFKYSLQAERLSNVVQDSLQGVRGTSARNMSYTGIDGKALRNGLENWQRELGTGTRGEDALEKLIGKQQRDNLFNLADANLTSEGRQATNTILARAVSILGTGGGPIRAMFGVTPHTASAAALYYGTKKLLELAVTNPGVGRQLAYAVEHNVGPKIAARVLAGMVSDYFTQRALGKQEQPTQ